MKTPRFFLSALLAALVVPCARPAAAQPIPRAGEVTVGIAWGIGTRMGPGLMLRVMASDDVGAACKVSAFVHWASWSCGAELYPFHDDAYYLVAELGKATAFGPRMPTGPGEWSADRFVFLNLGAGWEVRGDPTSDEYLEQVRAYTAAGLTLSLFADGEEDGARTGDRPFVRPGFFWDLVGVSIIPNARR